MQSNSEAIKVCYEFALLYSHIRRCRRQRKKNTRYNNRLNILWLLSHTPQEAVNQAKWL